MKKLTTILLLALITTACSIYPRTGRDFISRRQNAKAYAAAVEMYGSSWLPAERVESRVTAVQVPERVEPGTFEVAFVWTDTCLYSANTAVRWLQKRDLWRVDHEVGIRILGVGDGTGDQQGLYIPTGDQQLLILN